MQESDYLNPLAFAQELDSSANLNEFLQSLSQSKKLKNIFINQHVKIDKDRPFLFILNGTTGSGKDTMLNLLTSDSILHKAITGVSRDRRANEAVDSHVWFRKPLADETPQEYLNNIVREYDLIEHDVHHGNIYGLPMKNLEEVASKGNVVVRNEPNGARTLIENLGGTFNIIVLFLVPDSWSQILERIQKPGEERDNRAKRLEDSLEMLKNSKFVTHYYIHNTENPAQYGSNETDGILYTYDSMKELITTVTKCYSFEE